ncbi:ELM1/GtrOC1 family putative glycosyltransferase [Gammaproteobacteria bacterium]|nr:ELM1/GtrOC1 family putative glycosyltransferase [Gammaproteobacteria bacterium]
MEIWWYKDNKIGHTKQVSVLIDELKKEFDVSLKEIKCKKSILLDVFNLCSAFIVKDSHKKPDILIGAGHSTYLKILADKVKYGGKKTKSISIMKPSFLRSWFDLICAPEHDYDKSIENNTYTFKGSLAKVIDEPPDNDLGLIAIGGVNNHYEFSNDEIYKQIEFIINLHQKDKWFIYNSRRTNRDLSIKLSTLADNSSIEFIDIDNKSAPKLSSVMSRASSKFVTPDSVNLVFESLSTQGSTYLLHLIKKRNHKITKLMSNLILTRDVGYVESKNMTESLQTYSIKSPIDSHQTYAEVEKVAYKILQLIKS